MTERKLKDVLNWTMEWKFPFKNKMKFGKKKSQKIGIKEHIHPQHKLRLSMENSNPE